MADRSDTDPNAAPGPPELEALARRYLDLWQEHWAATAADPHAASEMARAFRLMTGPWAAWAGVWGAPGSEMSGTGGPAPPPGSDAIAAMQAMARAWAGGSGREPGATRAEAGQAAPGAATPAAAPGNGAGRLDELVDRLAAVEDRLARLESLLAERDEAGRERKPARRAAKSPSGSKRGGARQGRSRQTTGD